MVGVDFQCNYSGEHLPFLRFLMEYGPSTVDFPKCELMCSDGSADIDDSKNEEMDTYFQNECKKRLLDFFVIEGQFENIGDFGELLNKSYRGYKEIAEIEQSSDSLLLRNPGSGLESTLPPTPPSKEIVVVFDITNFLNIPLRTSSNPAWIILDDLENQVLPISPKVLQFFRETEYMKQIRDPLNNLVELPKSMYLYDANNSRFMVKSERSEWLDSRSFHPTYGSFYYFKSLNIGANENPQVIETYRKCVVFLKNYADFCENDDSIGGIGKNIPLSFDDKLSPDILKDLSDSLLLRNQESELESTLPPAPPSKSVESVKSNIDIDISPGDLDIDNLELSEDSDEDNDLHKSEYIDKSRDIETDDEIQQNLPFVSLIMFSEKGGSVYCVKTESIFTEL